MKNNYDNYIYEEITLEDFAKKFANLTNFDVPSVTDLEGDDVQVLTLDSNGKEVYKDILSFVVKPAVDYHFTDGTIKVTENHTFVEGALEVKAQDHQDFVRVNEPIKVVDIEVADAHTYLANGRLNHNTTSGGKALGFHSTVRVRLNSVGKIKAKQANGKEEIVGVQTEATIIKNRVGPPFKKAQFEIYFNSGIDDVNSWLNILKEYDLLKQSGAWYELVNEETGEVFKFQSKDWKNILIQNDALKTYCYNRICEAVISKYKSESIDPDNLQLDDSDLAGLDE